MRGIVGCICEPMEDRRLLSSVVDVRLPGGGKDINASDLQPGVGVTLEIWVQLIGANTTVEDERLQGMIGAFLSTDSGSKGGVRGDLRATRAASFSAGGSASGTQIDLDGDGDLDIGSFNPSAPAGFFAVRSATLRDDGSSLATGREWLVGSLTFTPKQILTGGGSTAVNFRPRGGGTDGYWQVDGESFINGYEAGTPVVIHNGRGPVTPRDGVRSPFGLSAIDDRAKVDLSATPSDDLIQL